ncbi:MAG: Septum site-determining protein DivIVA [Firmicutes bacterium]|nr:Septum site-determining protein DivIVA [candidate division NPL-UPA2 bacterium]MBT9154060.1 Septum site-determining protein DivIVA [candidate division NPL-UPA2 bacterium]MBT9156299.1 Septum site-determining protein DivIVA [candidate division NPL-UPA2 bacterium]
MALTPQDINKKEFKRTMRGYHTEEVDDFLDQVTRDYEGSLRELSTSREQVAKLEDKLTHYYKLEQTLHGALVVAQETAEEVKNSARREAQLLVKEAEMRAEKIVEEAIAKSRKMAGEYQEVQKQAEIFRGRLRALLQAQLEMISASDWDKLNQ